MTSIIEGELKLLKNSPGMEIEKTGEEKRKSEKIKSTSDDITNSIEKKELNSRQEISAFQNKKETSEILKQSRNLKKRGNNFLEKELEKKKRNKKNQTKRKSKSEKESILYKEIIFYSNFLLKLKWSNLDPKINPSSICILIR